MSERIDRRMGSGGLWLVTLAIAVVLAGAAGSYLWLQKDGLSSLPPAREQSADRLLPTDEPLMVTLYVPGNGVLTTGLAAVERRPDTQDQARAAMVKALAGMSEVQSPVLRDLKLREFFLDAAGTAYVDLNPVLHGGIKASAEEEILALYAIVNTLTHNFEEIKQVRFLIEGKEAQTLAGHIDLSKTFQKRMDLTK